VNSIIIDTNGLCAQAQYGVDVLGQLVEMGFNDFMVTNCTMNELERLRTCGNPRERAAAEVGASLIPRCRLIENGTGAVDCDDSIALKAKELNVAVFSLDRLLRRKLTAQGTPVVYLRGGKKLKTMA